MWLTHRNRRCVEIDDEVFRRLLTFYPEEDLLSRPIPAKALASGEISKADLQKEAGVHFIPWQMFLLTRAKLKGHLAHIERERKDKVQVTELSARSGGGGFTPYRLIDRYIRTQNFLRGSTTLRPNTFNGSLRGLSVARAVEHLEAHFKIDRGLLRGKRTKEQAIEYLVECLERGHVNVALGTSEARLVPSSKNHRSLYKNVSGFCLRDAGVPFVFVNMNMADEEEPAGRRMYTLILLTVLIGLGIYTVTRDWRPGRPPGKVKDTYLPHAHRIVSEFLLPSDVVEAYRGRRVTADVIREISDKYKLTPTAVIFRLWKAKVISSDEKTALTQPAVLIKSRARSPRIDTAVRKVNGGLVVAAVNGAYQGGAITPNQAQYILFGRVRRPLWRKYVQQVGL
jgi:hypothetical protein